MTFPLLSQFNPETGEVAGYSPKPRFLENLKGYFLDEVAYLQALQAGNPVIYSVTSVEPAHGDGQLHYGLGKIMPGKIGREYYFTSPVFTKVLRQTYDLNYLFRKAKEEGI